MTAGFPKTRVTNHYQIAYVTTDIDRAVEVFRDKYGIPSFLVWKDVTIEVKTPRGSGPFTIHVAFVWVGTVQYEIIQPVAGPVGLYWDVLPKEGFGLVFHHLAYQFIGEREEWLRFRASLGEQRVFAIEGPADYQVQFVYTDDREWLGHYSEYTWFGPGGQDGHAAIPKY
jgi:Glyoxalase/Bleomycin resistance protein/Dioxygenase superfamily